MNLLTKLTIILFSFAILLMIVFSYSFFEVTHSILRESNKQSQLEFAQATMLRIDEKMHGRYLDIQNFANSQTFEKFVLDHNNDINKEEAQQRIDSFLKTTGKWDVLSILDVKTDTFILSTYKGETGKKIGKDLDNKKAYEEALANRVFVSDLVFSKVTGLPTVIFSAPIKNEKEESQPIIGVIIGQMSWSSIEKVVKNTENTTRNIHLFTKNKTMIADNGDQKNLFKESTEVFKDEKISKGEVISVITENYEREFEALVSQAPQLGYLEYKGSGWKLIVETPSSLFLVPAYKKSQEVLIFVIPIVFSVVLFLLLILNRFITSPIKRLTKTAQEIAKGNMIQQSQIHSKDEIGHLSQSFNLMTDSLIKASNYIENIIKTMPMSLIVTDSEGKIKTVNEATLKMLGYKKEELLGKDINMIFVTQTSDIAKLLKRLGLEKLDREKYLENVRTHLKSKKGEKIRVDLSINLLAEKEGEIKKIKGGVQISSIIFIAKDLRELTYYAYKRLNKTTPILQKVANGDFSENVEISKEEDEFTEHMVAIQVMINGFREMFQELQKNSEDLKIHNKKLKEVSEELKKSKEGLEIKVSERTQDLEKNKTELEIKVSERTSQLFDLNKNLEDEVQKRTTELKSKLLELKKFNKIAIGRELRMVELKEEIKRLKGVVGAFENQL